MAEEIDHGTVVLMIDLPPDELPWLAAHPTAEWVGDQLRLGKRSILDQYWDRDWRRDNDNHTGPEDQLRRAATAVIELEGALTEFGATANSSG